MFNYLLFTAVTVWDEPHRSRHQVTNELKKKGVVYFVERNRIGKPRIELTKVEENVILISPYFYVDYRIRYRAPGLNEIYYKWLFKKIKALDLDFEIVFTFDHTSHLIDGFYNNVIYYCSDDHIGNGKFNPFFVNTYHRKTERLLTGKVKMCITTADYLYEKLKQYNKNTHLVHLGSPPIDPSLVSYKTNVAPVPELAIVAYLDKRMPLDLLDKIIDRFPLIFIGPCDANIKKRYFNKANANFVGIKKGKELFDIINSVDVCIAPYDEPKLNKGVTPSKLFLYLAFGKPAVVTEIRNIRNWDFGNKILYKTNNEDFVQKISDAYTENTLELFNKRIELARLNSWENRVDDILKLYYAT